MATDKKSKKFKKLMDQAQEHLNEGEEVLQSVRGAYETKLMGSDTVREGVLLATTNRLFFYAKKMGGYESESFPYHNISSFEAGKGMLGHTISFYASGNKVKVKWINEGDIDGFMNHMRGTMDGKDSVSTEVPSMESAADEIKKLAELRDAGVLTEEEFNSKKKQLLNL